MAVVLTNNLKIDLNNLGDRSFNDFYIKATLEGGAERIVKLTDLYDEFDRVLFADGETQYGEDTLEQIINGLATGAVKVHIVDKSGVIKVDKIDGPVMTTAKAVSTALSNNYEKSVFGLEQIIGVSQSTADYNENTKVYVKLRADKDFTLVDAKDIYIFANGVSTRLSELTDRALLDAIQNGTSLDNVRLIVHNRDIDVLDKAKFEQTSVIKQESLSVATDLTGNPILFHQGIEDTESLPVLDSVVLRSYKQEENDSYIESRKFDLDASRTGKYIHVVDRQGKQHFVNIDDLFEGPISVPSQIDTERFATTPEVDPTNNYLYFVGKPLLLKDNEQFIELEPLTAEQVIKVYVNTTYSPTVTTKKEDIAQEGTYRKTKDGKYFEESKIQPICYDYADGDAEFSHYLFTIDLPTGPQSIIVPRSKFVDRSSIRVQIDASIATLNLTGAIRPHQLKRTSKPLNQCAVVQRTTNHSASYNKATVLKDKNSNEVLDDETTQQLQNEFLQQYRDGEYVVNDAYNDAGELIEFSDSADRYIMTDYVKMPDFAGKNAYYNNFESAILTLKDGKFKGEVTYNKKKANKAYASVAKSVAKTSMKLMVTPLGFLSMLAFPVLPLVAGASMVSIPVARMINAVRANNSRRSINKNLESPLQLNRNQAEKVIFDDLQKLYNSVSAKWQLGQRQAVKNNGKDAVYQLTDAEFGIVQEEFLKLKEKLELSFQKENADGVLHVVDGKAEINGQNAYLARRYEEILNEKNKEIKKLTSQVKHAKGAEKVALQAQLDELIMLRDNMMKDFVLTHDELPENKQAYLNGLMFLKLAQGLVVAKFSKENTQDWLLDSNTQQILKDLKVDFANHTIKYKHKKYASVGDLISAHPELNSFINDIVNLGDRAVASKHQDVNGKAIEPKHITEAEHVDDLTAEEGVDIVAESAKEDTADDLVDSRADEHTPEAPAEIVTDDNRNLIEKLTEKLQLAQATQQIINDKIQNDFNVVLSLLEKDNMTDEEQQIVVQYIEDLSAQATNLKQLVEDISKGVGEINGTTEEIIANIQNITESIKEFNANISSCATNIEKLKGLLVKRMDSTQAQNILEKINALQTIIEGYQSQIATLIVQIAGDLKTLIKNEQDIEKYLQQIEQLQLQLQQAEQQLASLEQKDNEKIESLMQQLAEEQAKNETLARELEKYRATADKLAQGRQAIIESAGATIALIDEILSGVIIDDSKFDQLKAQALSGELYGLKTKITNATNEIVAVQSKLKNQMSMVDQRIKSLETLVNNLEDSDDPQLQQVRAKATEKIDVLQDKKLKIEKMQTSISELVAKYSMLKQYVDIVKVHQDAEKCLADKMFSGGLSATEKDIKFLAKAISNFKNVYKQQTEIVDFEQINTDNDYNLEELKTKLPTILTQLQEFIRANYNIFNECTDETVKNNYYSKLASYSLYDHSVVFMMPTNANADGSLNV